MAELSNFFCILCAKELSQTVVAEMEQLAPVLLCKLEKIFPPVFFNPMQHMILHLPYEARMGGGLCRAAGAMQLRDNKRFFEPNVKINAKLKLPLQRHIVLRRCQTSRPNTMQRPCLTCIIHPLVTMPTKMKRTSASLEGNSEVQVVRLLRPCNMKSDRLS